jgi:hypothetical protein
MQILVDAIVDALHAAVTGCNSNAAGAPEPKTEYTSTHR